MGEDAPAERHFTLEEANSLLPAVRPLLETLRDAHARMEERQEDVMGSIPTNGGGVVHREFLDASTEAAEVLEELEGIGVVVRDPASGLIDFPAWRGDDEILLCWRLGEDSIAWWHPPETGFAGRQPL